MLPQSILADDRDRFRWTKSPQVARLRDLWGQVLATQRCELASLDADYNASCLNVPPLSVFFEGVRKGGQEQTPEGIRQAVWHLFVDLLVPGPFGTPGCERPLAGARGARPSDR